MNITTPIYHYGHLFNFAGVITTKTILLYQFLDEWVGKAGRFLTSPLTLIPISVVFLLRKTLGNLFDSHSGLLNTNQYYKLYKFTEGTSAKRESFEEFINLQLEGLNWSEKILFSELKKLLSLMLKQADKLSSEFSDFDKSFELPQSGFSPMSDAEISNLIPTCYLEK